MDKDDGGARREKWARLRFAVVGPLLASPPPAGQLGAELERLSQREWEHPSGKGPVRFAASTIERWYYRARAEQQDPVKALRRKLRTDVGRERSMSAGLIAALLDQYRAHPSWSAQLHYETWREEHLFALEQAMQRYDFLTQQIDDCEVRVMAEIERLTPPDDPPDGGAPDPAPGTISDTASSRSANAATNDTGREGIQPLALRKMMGVDLTAIPTVGPGTALVIASEIGPDFSAFPSAQHFCSWLALAPGTRISGGKNLPGKSPKAVNPVGQALRMAAMAARRSQTFIGAKHRARLARMDTPVAIKATARELACLVYLMVTEGQEYVEQGIGAYEKRRLNRKFAHLDRQARKLGLQLVPKMQGEEKQNPMLSIA